MKELNIIINVTEIGIILSGIILIFTEPNILSISLSDILIICIFGLLIGSLIFIIKGRIFYER